jgi:SAM-dependent methyltransferase
MDVDLNLFKNIMDEVRENTDLLDSLSPNQFKSKLNLINHINSLDILNKDSEIVIFGCWYGSILIPAYYNKVKRITAIDMDAQVISRNKYRLYPDYKQLDFITGDVFEWAADSSRIKKTDLIINASCENMKSMSELELNTNAYFAFQSNNMTEIHDSVNCVKDMKDFEKQMPFNGRIIKQDTVEDERGTRFTIIGRYNKFSEGLMR